MSKQSLAGHPGHLTTEQSNALIELKQQLLSDGTIQAVPVDKYSADDALLTKFLRARDFNVQKSRKMFNDCEHWRKEMNLDELAEKFQEEFTERPLVVKYWREYWHKTDKMGRPVNIQHLGKLDMDNLYKVSTEDRLTKYLAYGANRASSHLIPICIGLRGEPLEALSIIDLKGFKWGEFIKGRRFFQTSTKMLQDYFPESIGSILVINAPPLFSKLWSWLKPWLAEVTASKVTVLSGDARDELLSRIPAENLPSFLGGSCTCGGKSSSHSNGQNDNDNTDNKENDEKKKKRKKSDSDENYDFASDPCVLSDAGPWTDGPLPQYLFPAELPHSDNDINANNNKDYIQQILEHGVKIQNGNGSLGPWTIASTPAL